MRARTSRSCGNFNYNSAVLTVFLTRMALDIDVTVAAIIENDGRFLLVEEVAGGQIVLNQPAGHVENHESLLAAVVRETREETGFEFQATNVVGISALGMLGAMAGDCYAFEVRKTPRTIDHGGTNDRAENSAQ